METVTETCCTDGKCFNEAIVLEDPKRADKLSLVKETFILILQKQNYRRYTICSSTWQRETKVKEAISAMFSGKMINETEKDRYCILHCNFGKTAIKSEGKDK